MSCLLLPGVEVAARIAPPQHEESRREGYAGEVSSWMLPSPARASPMR